jgi:hypothetical protein
MAKFLSIESFGCHKQILLLGFEKAKSTKSGQILIYGSIPEKTYCCKARTPTASALVNLPITYRNAKSPALPQWLVVLSLHIKQHRKLI